MYYYVEGELRDIPVDIPIPHSIKASLMASIAEVYTTMDRDMVKSLRQVQRLLLKPTAILLNK